jgi:chromosome segregation ATPase
MFGKVFKKGGDAAAVAGEDGGGAVGVPPATPSGGAFKTTTTAETMMSPGASDPNFVPPPDAVSLVQEDIEEGPRGDLEKQIRDRDSNISSLEKIRLEKHAELAALQKELEEERLRQMKESILHRIEVERLKRQTKAVEERLEALEKDMQDKDAIHEYANLIKGVAPKGGVDSQYVMKLQSQLAKAVKKMDATAHQMAQVEQSCEEVVGSLKKEISEIVEDRCRTELELRKQLELLEEQKAEMQAEYDDRIRENQKELDRLKSKVNVETSVADLEKELEETEVKLEQLNNIHEMQERTIEELKETLENGEDAAAAPAATTENGDD